jgi:hypothetical protein
MAWTTPVDAVLGQIAGESSGMFSLNTYVRDNFDWLNDNKMTMPFSHYMDPLTEIPAAQCSGFQVQLSGHILSGNSGTLKVEIGPTATWPTGKIEIAKVGSTDALSVDEYFSIDFFIPNGYKALLTVVDDFVIETSEYILTIWGYDS